MLFGSYGFATFIAFARAQTGPVTDKTSQSMAITAMTLQDFNSVITGTAII